MKANELMLGDIVFHEIYGNAIVETIDNDFGDNHMNAQEIYNKRIKEAAYEESSTYDLTEIKESNAAYNAAIKVANFALKNQWISVEEALPTENRILAKLSPPFCGREDYLEILHRIPIEMVDLKHPLGYYDSCGENIPTSAITHWMPIRSIEGGEK